MKSTETLCCRLITTFLQAKSAARFIGTTHFLCYHLYTTCNTQEKEHRQAHESSLTRLIPATRIASIKTHLKQRHPFRQNSRRPIPSFQADAAAHCARRARMGFKYGSSRICVSDANFARNASALSRTSLHRHHRKLPQRPILLLSPPMNSAPTTLSQFPNIR